MEKQPACPWNQRTTRVFLLKTILHCRAAGGLNKCFLFLQAEQEEDVRSRAEISWNWWFSLLHPWHSSMNSSVTGNTMAVTARWRQGPDSCKGTEVLAAFAFVQWNRHISYYESRSFDLIFPSKGPDDLRRAYRFLTTATIAHVIIFRCVWKAISPPKAVSLMYPNSSLRVQ